ncbi:Carrier protein, mitochondrial [Orobanche minor]
METSKRYRGIGTFWRDEGLSRLWRGTNASLALAVPSVGIYMPLYDIFRNYLEDLTLHNAPIITPYVPPIAGSLARSIACLTCYPIELARTRMQTEAFKLSQGGRDAVSAHLDSGKPIGEQGVEDAFELLYEIKECYWMYFAAQFDL